MVPCDTSKIQLKEQINIINHENKMKINLKNDNKDVQLDLLVSI
jgi:hypothetical protein